MSNYITTNCIFIDLLVNLCLCLCNSDVKSDNIKLPSRNV